jgi:hypothetical protein
MFMRKTTPARAPIEGLSPKALDEALLPYLPDADEIGEYLPETQRLFHKFAEEHGIRLDAPSPQTIDFLQTSIDIASRRGLSGELGINYLASQLATEAIASAVAIYRKTSDELFGRMAQNAVQSIVRTINNIRNIPLPKPFDEMTTEEQNIVIQLQVQRYSYSTAIAFSAVEKLLPIGFGAGTIADMFVTDCAQTARLNPPAFVGMISHYAEKATNSDPKHLKMVQRAYADAVTKTDGMELLTAINISSILASTCPALKEIATQHFDYFCSQLAIRGINDKKANADYETVLEACGQHDPTCGLHTRAMDIYIKVLFNPPPPIPMPIAPQSAYSARLN